MIHKSVTAAMAVTFSLAGGVSAQAEELARTRVSAPGSTMFVISTHLASVPNERHGYSVEVAAGYPGIRSQVNITIGKADTLFRRRGSKAGPRTRQRRDGSPPA